MVITKTISITPEKSEYYSKLLSMTGDEIYDKYGLKRDETITLTCDFNNDIEADIKLVICDGNDTPYVEGVLFDNGCEVTCTDAEDEIIGEWHFQYNDNTYIAHVVVE